MRGRLFILAAAILLLPGSSAEEQKSEPKELPIIKAQGELQKAVDFRLPDLGGERWRLYETEGPVVLLHFWSQYRDNRYDLQLLEKLHRKYRDRGVVILGLVFSSGTREELTEYLDELGVSFPTLMTPNRVRLEYDVATFPTTFLLDGDKMLRYWMYGIMVEEHWDTIIAELLEDQAEVPR